MFFIRKAADTAKEVAKKGSRNVPCLVNTTGE
jgi:hypothetical protein